MSVEKLTKEQAAAVSFLDNLRSKTSESHKQLELLPISQAIVDPTITVAQYAMYLNLMYDVIENLETKIYPILNEVISDLEDRKKAHFIVNDLKVIGVKRKEQISLFQDVHKMSVPFAMGIIYVVEGSTLGGRFIVKNIQESLGYDEENGASYFSGYGNKTGSFWKKFLNYLTDFETLTNSQQEIIAGADYAFTIIAKHLSENYSL